MNPSAAMARLHDEAIEREGDSWAIREEAERDHEDEMQGLLESPESIGYADGANVEICDGMAAVVAAVMGWLAGDSDERLKVEGYRLEGTLRRHFREEAIGLAELRIIRERDLT